MNTIKHNCSKCGADVFNKAPYCSNCGVRLVYSEESQANKTPKKPRNHKRNTLEFLIFSFISGILLYNGYRESGLNISYILEGYLPKEVIIDLILILIPPIALMLIFFKSLKWFLGACFMMSIVIGLAVFFTQPQL